MSDTTAAFLQGQGVPVALPDVEAELTRLWGPAAERVGGPDLDQPSVTRVVLANLIVACAEGEAARIDGVLDTLASRYPCRTIVLRSTADPERRVLAEVSALCHLPAPGLPQVCSERITLGSGPSARDLVAGAVRPLLEADLPCVLWWAEAPKAGDTLVRELAGEATRVLLEPPEASDPRALRDALDPEKYPFARDVAWYGITRWRELVAGLFDPPETREALGRIATVEVRAVAPTADHPARAAAWLAAWLAGQLGWDRPRRVSGGAGQVAATFRGPAGDVAVRLVTTADPRATIAHLTGVSLTCRGTDGDHRFQVDRPDPSGAEVRIEESRPGQPDQSRTLAAPEPDAAGRLAAALESTREDPPFLAALPHALWLLGA